MLDKSQDDSNRRFQVGGRTHDDIPRAARVVSQHMVDSSCQNRPADIFSITVSLACSWYGEYTAGKNVQEVLVILRQELARQGVKLRYHQNLAKLNFTRGESPIL